MMTLLSSFVLLYRTLHSDSQSPCISVLLPALIGVLIREGAACFSSHAFCFLIGQEASPTLLQVRERFFGFLCRQGNKQNKSLNNCSRWLLSSVGTWYRQMLVKNICTQYCSSQRPLLPKTGIVIYESDTLLSFGVEKLCVGDVFSDPTAQ